MLEGKQIENLVLNKVSVNKEGKLRDEQVAKMRCTTRIVLKKQNSTFRKQ